MTTNSESNTIEVPYRDEQDENTSQDEDDSDQDESVGARPKRNRKIYLKFQMVIKCQKRVKGLD